MRREWDRNMIDIHYRKYLFNQLEQSQQTPYAVILQYVQTRHRLSYDS
jgi:hypothetical protein